MGLEIAKLLAKDSVVLLSGRHENKVEAAKEKLKGCGEFEYMCMDVGSAEDVKAFAAKAQGLGEVVNVVHTAGVNEYIAGKPTPAHYIIENNVRGAVNMGETFLPIIAEGGSYINIASMSSYYYPMEQYLDMLKEAYKGNLQPMLDECGEDGTKSYAFTKMFVRWYTMANIDRASARGARINSISPGIIWTDMSKDFEDKAPGSITGFAATLPIGRMGQAKEVAELVEFLCKPGYIHGTDILIDGGNVNYCRTEQIEA